VLIRSVRRVANAFQEPVTPDQLTAMAHRAFGRTDIAAADELAGGLYNTTYRVQPTGQPPVILRVAPRPARQSRVERALMRNEHAALPWFAPIAAMMPRTLLADWTHDILDRDYVWQTMLPGEAATQGLRSR
jgi:hypothetical protein